jgi:pimeloyl-ACP methyl ester carboxylesterase
MPFVNNRGVNIRYEVEGQGPSLVLNHGFSENLITWYWKGFVEALKDAYQLILFDVRGHGASDKPHHPDAYVLADYASDVIALLDALEIDQAHFFGYSLGGWTGFGLAQHAPDRLRSLTIGGVHPYGSSLAVYREMLKDGLEGCFAFLETAADIPIPAKMREAHFGNDIRSLRAAYRNDRPDISASISAMRLPCLLFAGETDPLYPAIRRCASELPKAIFLSLPGLNHIQVSLQLKRVLPSLITFLVEAEAQV